MDTLNKFGSICRILQNTSIFSIDFQQHLIRYSGFLESHLWIISGETKTMESWNLMLVLSRYLHSNEDSIQILPPNKMAQRRSFAMCWIYLEWKLNLG